MKNILFIALLLTTFIVRAENWFAKGIEAYNKGFIKEAIECFNYSITKNKDFAEGYYNLGICYVKLGDIDKGILYYNQALALKPKYAEA